MNFLADSMKILSIAIFSIAAILLAYYFLKELGWIRFNIKWLAPEPYIPAISVHIRNTAPNKSDDIRSKNSNTRILSRITLYCLATRLFIYLAGYMAQMLVNNQAGGILSMLEGNWNHWDSPHYLYLAQHWYTNMGEPALFIVFYPLYPFLVKITAAVLFLKNYFAAGIIVSNICLIFACFYLYKLVALELGEKLSESSVKFVMIFPFSFFFSIAYTESLFLLLSIMSFYYMRKKGWLLAGLSGLLAALSRNQGLLLLMPAFIEFIGQLNSSGLVKTRQYKKMGEFILRKGICVLLIPIGSFLYLLLNKMVMGDWFAFLTVQKSNWQNSFGFFADTVRYLVINSLSWKPSERISLWVPQVFTFIFISIMMFYSFRKLRLSYTAYIFVYALITFSPAWLLSSPRYIAALFPIYMLLGTASENKAVDRLLSYAFVLFLCFYSMAFALGKAVM